MLKKNIRFVVGMILIISLCLAAKMCARNPNKTKSGSSEYNVFAINAPSGLTATLISSSQINIFWTDNSNNEDGFEIERRTFTTQYSVLTTVSANTNVYTDISAIPYTIYYYRVRTFNILGDQSAYSNEAMVSPFQARPTTWLSVTAGESSSIALAPDRSLWVWGGNRFGELGLGDSSPLVIVLPAQLANDVYWSTIEAGYNHTLSIKTNGTLWAWGDNTYGGLGLGDWTTRTYPVSVGSDSDWSIISAGANHSTALKTNRTLWVWGSNNLGQLGLGDTIDRNSPVQLDTCSDWLTVSCGSSTFAIKTDKTLWSWGWNQFGQLGIGTKSIPFRTTPGLILGTSSDWSAVNAAYTHAIALKTNGTLWIWGEIVRGTCYLSPVQINTELDWSLISAGGSGRSSVDGSWSLAIKTNGTVWAWGNNINGQLGIGYLTLGYTLIPTQIGTYSDWALAAAGGSNSFAINTSGILYSWGGNADYQLGLGETISRNMPCLFGSPIPPLGLAATIISSSQISLSWTDGSDNEDGFIIECSIFPTSGYSFVTTVGPDVTSYSDTGLVWATTYYYRIKAYNAIGDSPYSNPANATTPGTPSGLVATVISLSQINLSWVDNSSNEVGFMIERKIGRSGTYAEIDTVSADVTSYSDTSVLPNTYYYYRVAAYDAYSNTAYTNVVYAAVSGDWSKCSGGRDFTMGLKTNGTLFAWGANNASFGQLGLGDSITRNINTPTQIGSSSDWLTTSSGQYYTIAVRNNPAGEGTLWAWGDNSRGQLGDNSTTKRISPRQIGTLSDWRTVGAGSQHSFGIKTNPAGGGTLWAWGYNNTYQVGDGSSNNRISPRQIGDASDWSICAGGWGHTIGLKTNNTIWTWGKNDYGQLGLGDTDVRKTPIQMGTNSDWFAIATGYEYTLAIKTDNTLWGWGANNAGQLGLGDSGINRNTPTRVRSESLWATAAGGSTYSSATKTNGTVWGWGTGYGASSLPAQIDTELNYFLIGSGWNHHMAIKANNTLWTWGENNYGQLGLGDNTNRNTPTLVGE